MRYLERQKSQIMTSRDYFRSLGVLHGALVAGQVLFSGILFAVTHNGAAPPRPAETIHQEDLFFYGAMVLVLGDIVASYFVYRKRLEQAREQPGLPARLGEYRRALLLRDFLLEMPSLLAVIAFYVTGNEKYLSLTGLIVFLFLLSWPTRDRVITELGLEGDPRLQDPDADLGDF
jgi:hypothetical protein